MNTNIAVVNIFQHTRSCRPFRIETFSSIDKARDRMGEMFAKKIVATLEYCGRLHSRSGPNPYDPLDYDKDCTAWENGEAKLLA